MSCALGTSVEAHLYSLVYATNDVVRGVGDSDGRQRQLCHKPNNSKGQQWKMMTTTTLDCDDGNDDDRVVGNILSKVDDTLIIVVR